MFNKLLQINSAADIQVQLLHIFQIIDQLIIVALGWQWSASIKLHQHLKALIHTCPDTKIAQRIDILGKMPNQYVRHQHK